MRQIADRIPKAYMQENGEQLTVSQASQLAVPTEGGDVPVTSIFVRPDTSRGLAEESDIDAYSGADVVSYGLCGLGTSAQCAITEGTPSTERFTLLHRQALELSLYTFKYVDDVDSVLVFMPPTPQRREQRHDLPAARRRRRRAPAAALSAACPHARRASEASARSSWATSRD